MYRIWEVGFRHDFNNGRSEYQLLDLRLCGKIGEVDTVVAFCLHLVRECVFFHVFLKFVFDLSGLLEYIPLIFGISIVVCITQHKSLPASDADSPSSDDENSSST